MSFTIATSENVVFGEAQMIFVEGDLARIAGRQLPHDVGQQEAVVAFADANVGKRIFVGQGDDRAVAGSGLDANRAPVVFPKDVAGGGLAGKAAKRVLDGEPPVSGRGKLVEPFRQPAFFFGLAGLGETLGGGKDARRPDRERHLLPVEPVLEILVVAGQPCLDREVGRFAGDNDQGVAVVDPSLQRGDLFFRQTFQRVEHQQNADAIERLAGEPPPQPRGRKIQPPQNFVARLRAAGHIEEGRGYADHRPHLFRHKKPMQQRCQQGHQQDDAQQDAISAC